MFKQIMLMSMMEGIMNQFFKILFYFIIFFFQAEDGIRDIGVTGVQTCALPISHLQASSCKSRTGGTSDSMAL